MKRKKKLESVKNRLLEDFVVKQKRQKKYKFLFEIKISFLTEKDSFLKRLIKQ